MLGSQTSEQKMLLVRTYIDQIISLVDILKGAPLPRGFWAVMDASYIYCTFPLIPMCLPLLP
jgi:hypothetical protein